MRLDTGAATVCLLLLFSGSAPAAEESPWNGVLERGRFAVGFVSETIERPLKGGGSRTLTLSIWYPALEGTGRDGRVEDLFEVVLGEEQLAETDGLEGPRALAAAMTGRADAVSAETAARTLTMQVYSRPGAEPASGAYPLVLWSSRHATTLAQAPISEVLASRGMVVAYLWTSEPPLAFLWEDVPEQDKLATIDVQTDDLVYGLAELRRRPNVASGRTVVLSWSYGGQTAARLQERDDGIVGVVGLDANVVPARPEERLSLRVPLVWLLGRDSEGRGLENASGVGAPIVVLAMPDLAHGNFNALEGFLPGLAGAETVYRWSQGGPIAVAGYAALARVVLTATRQLLDVPAPIDGLAERAAGAAGDVDVRVVHESAPQP